MRYAICNETFCDWPLPKALQFAVDAGYQGWEVAPFMLTDNIYEFSQAERQQYRQSVESAGIPIIGLHWLLAKTEGLHLTRADSEMQKRTSDYLCELARLCRDLGGQVMVLGSPQQRNLAEGQSMDEAMANAAKVIKAAVPVLEECDVQIALEPLGPVEGDFLNTAAEGRELQAMVGSENVQLHLDVKAMSTEAMPIADVIRTHSQHMVHFHANDPNLLGPGMGDVDFVPIFDALKEVEYSGWVSVEVFDYSPGVETILGSSMDNMRAAIG